MIIHPLSWFRRKAARSGPPVRVEVYHNNYIAPWLLQGFDLSLFDLFVSPPANGGPGRAA